MSNYWQSNTIRAFNEISSFDFIKLLKTKINSEIDTKSKEYILSIDEEEYINYLAEKYKLEPLEIDHENEIVDKPQITSEIIDESYVGNELSEAYIFTVKYRFTGSPELFRVKPRNFRLVSPNILVDQKNMIVSFKFKLFNRNPAEFIKAKNNAKGDAFANLGNSISVVNEWNSILSDYISSHFQALKNKYQQENNFFAAINIKVDESTKSVFSVPTIQKRIIPEPEVSKNKEFSSEPMMSKETHEDLINIIYNFGKSIEKKPSIYKNKDEEGLRDQFLLILETRYLSTTATGETFNKEGKSDIILKYAKDNSNLFVAECKIWHGASEFSNAIYQLFDRYLTWRDSKAALLLFVSNRDFSNVLHTIKTEVPKHTYFVKEAGSHGESSFSYIFHLPGDNNKMVYLEVIAFHFDRLTSGNK